MNGDQSDNNASSSGAAYVFVRTAGAWSQQAYLKASNTDENDGFGDSVSVSGDTVVVSARFEDSSATGINGDQSDNSAGFAGAAYVFARTGSTWSQEAYLKASNTDFEDQFGTDVAVSGDTVVVGARGESSSATGVNGDQSDNSENRSGAAYVFVRAAGAWSQQAYIKASNTGTFDAFGDTVAISGDTVVVGAPTEDSSAMGVNGDQSDNSTPTSGATYVFARTGSTWSQQAYLKASNTDENDQFGISVAVSGDLVVVGALREDSSAKFVNGDQSDDSATDAGAAYVFARTGSTWSQQAYLKASNAGAGDLFGTSVAVSGDDVFIGTPREDSSATGVSGDQFDNGANNSGAAYLFEIAALDTIGSAICQPALPNSFGQPGTLIAEGSNVAADNNLTFLATKLPPFTTGFLVNSMNILTVPVAVSNGLLCIGPGYGRHSNQAVNTEMTGDASTTVDLTSLPRSSGPEPALAGQTWYFQFWHRDGANGSNFTNGIEILFQ